MPSLAAAAALLALLPGGYQSAAKLPPSLPETAKTPAEEGAAPRVWLVETAAGHETYSNGLRVEGLPGARTHARRYLALPREEGGPYREAGEPVGIVFHSSESQVADFEEAKTARLRLLGRSLVEYVRGERAYHYVVDRFGRVFRTVEESDAAYHAGWSVWADRNFVYVNLNESFLAVAFEAQSRNAAEQTPLTAAQVHAGRVLADMLRSKYRIDAANCVTHAQVSVNPRNLRVGYHSDWADGFPFASLGLPPNYALALPSVSLFGFEVDAPLENTGVGEGMLAAQLEIQREARRLRADIDDYRAGLRRRWKQAVRAIESAGPGKENSL